jgi:predicted metal-binding protein
MGCSSACNVTLQAPGKMAYTLGRFDPEAEAAAGIVAYASGHAASETGVVPFREWPQAVKGHFVTRHPPLG